MKTDTYFGHSLLHQRGLFIGLCLLLLNPTTFQVRAGGTVQDCSQAGLLGALAGGGEVKFACNGLILLTNTINIVANTTLNAAQGGVTLSGGGAVRLFNVSKGVTLTLIGLALTDGYSTNGGAIFNGGALNITNCSFARNTAAGPDGASGPDGGPGSPAAGGAIWNEGTLNISQSVFSANTVKSGNGGNGSNKEGNGGAGGDAGPALGGAIYNHGPCHVSATSFNQNTAVGGSGGNGTNAIQATNPRESSHSGGRGGTGASAAGGAIYNVLSPLTVQGCLFAGNSVSGGAGGSGGNGNIGVQTRGGNGGIGGSGGAASGGAIYDQGGTASSTNSTFASNTAIGGLGNQGGNGANCTGGRGYGGDAGGGGSGGDASGGAVFGGNLAAVILSNDTLSGNGATGGGRGTNGAPGIGCVGLGLGLVINEGTNGLSAGGATSSAATNALAFKLKNTILAASLNGSNSFGAIFDAGNNINSDSSGQFTNRTSFANTDPKLGPLGANGGPTLSFDLLDGSPALNAGDRAVCPLTDQRGVLRPQGAECDIGAVEHAVALILQKPNGLLRLVFSMVPNKPCVLQSSLDLRSWQEEPAAMVETNGMAIFEASSAPTAHPKFFRLTTPK